LLDDYVLARFKQTCDYTAVGCRRVLGAVVDETLRHHQHIASVANPIAEARIVQIVVNYTPFAAAWQDPGAPANAQKMCGWSVL
jgi:hypothetical protein